MCRGLNATRTLPVDDLEILTLYDCYLSGAFPFVELAAVSRLRE